MKVGRPGIRMLKLCGTAFFLSQLQKGADRFGEDVVGAPRIDLAARSPVRDP